MDREQKPTTLDAWRDNMNARLLFPGLMSSVSPLSGWWRATEEEVAGIIDADKAWYESDEPPYTSTRKPNFSTVVEPPDSDSTLERVFWTRSLVSPEMVKRFPQLKRLHLKFCGIVRGLYAGIEHVSIQNQAFVPCFDLDEAYFPDLKSFEWFQDKNRDYFPLFWRFIVGHRTLQTLDFKVGEDELDTVMLNNRLPRLRKLETLKIACHDECKNITGPCVKLCDFAVEGINLITSLKSLTLTVNCDHITSINLGNLHSFKLMGPFTDDAESLDRWLPYSQKMRSFSLVKIRNADSSICSLNVFAQRFPNLINLELGCFYNDITWDMVESAKFPQLKSLKLLRTCGIRKVIAPLLERLTAGYVTLADEDLEYIAGNFPNLERFTFSKPQSVDTIKQVIHALPHCRLLNFEDFFLSETATKECVEFLKQHALDNNYKMMKLEHPSLDCVKTVLFGYNVYGFYHP